MQKIDHLTKRCTDLLHDMKKHERESIKNKKRGDQLQKDKDSSRTELTKTVSLKEKLEKLCRELQKENNKLKVRGSGESIERGEKLTGEPLEREQDDEGQPSAQPEFVGREVRHASAETGRLPGGKGQAPEAGRGYWDGRAVSMSS